MAGRRREHRTTPKQYRQPTAEQACIFLAVAGTRYTERGWQTVHIQMTVATEQQQRENGIIASINLDKTNKNRLYSCAAAAAAA